MAKLSYYYETATAPKVLVYQKNDEIKGFCLLSAFNKEQLSVYTKHHPDVLKSNSTDLFGVIKTIAIIPTQQKNGIGSALFERAEYELKNMSVNHLLVPAWVYSGTMPIGGIIKKRQYKEWFYIKQFWLDLCTTELNCPKKKANHCACDLSFYQKKNNMRLLG